MVVAKEEIYWKLIERHLDNAHKAVQKGYYNTALSELAYAEKYTKRLAKMLEEVDKLKPQT